jgi:DNA-binding transcriptional LysR family regulator
MEQGVGDGQAAKELRIGTSITIGSCLLPGYIRELKERFPSLTVQAAVGNSEAIEQKLLENQIDIGIIEGMVHSPYIHCRTFPGDRLVFICPPAHPFAGHTLKSAEELAGQDLILRERGSAGREVLDGILAAGEISVKPLWESVSNEAVLEGVKAGLGLSLLPYYLVWDSLEKGQVKEFFIRGLALLRKFSVIYHKNKFLTKEARTLIGLAAGEEEG